MFGRDQIIGLVFVIVIPGIAAVLIQLSHDTATRFAAARGMAGSLPIDAVLGQVEF
jgi:hypothetical protein